MLLPLKGLGTYNKYVYIKLRIGSLHCVTGTIILSIGLLIIFYNRNESQKLTTV